MSESDNGKEFPGAPLGARKKPFQPLEKVNTALQQCDLAVAHLTISLHEFTTSTEQWGADEELSRAAALTREIVERLSPLLGRLAERGLYETLPESAALLCRYDPGAYNTLWLAVAQAAKGSA